MPSFRVIQPEIWIAFAMAALMTALSIIFTLPVILPSGERAAFVGVHYIYPLAGICLLGMIMFLFGNRKTALRFMIALPCYAVILFTHFNIKLWIPHINPLLFDDVYWEIDEKLYLLVIFCKYIRTNIFGSISYSSNFYMTSYIMMFYVSFCYHAIRTPKLFGQLILSLLLLQSLGTLGYLIAPAIGPFIYEEGVNPIISGGQAGMLKFYQASVTGGPTWLASHGSENFTVGLAAMPSLHAAAAFLFFLFAFHHGRPLLLPYCFILSFILVTAIASRWHYLIDLPVGMFMAWLSYRIAKFLDSGTAASEPVIAIEATEPATA